MIELSRVFKRYPGGIEALCDLSFSLDKGEMAFLTGHSGAGKSTLLRLLLGLENATSGTLRVAGQDITGLKRRAREQHRRRIGAIFQDHKLLSDATVADNVALPLAVAGFDPRDAQRRVRAALDKVGLLSKEKSYPGMLSAGEQQRVGIARAVVNRPALILADEPTGNLDPTLSLEIMSVFAQFAQIGVTVLIASHERGLIETLGRRSLMLQSGRLVSDIPATGSPSDHA
jgi:cell division transport system ATP-binding protein